MARRLPRSVGPVKPKLDWVRFFYHRFCACDAVMLMTPEQIGGYILLLCSAWDGDGTLPNDPTYLAGISRLGDRWPIVGPRIIELGFVVRANHLVNKQAVSTIRHARRRIADAKASAAKRWGTATSEIPHCYSSNAIGRNALEIRLEKERVEEDQASLASPESSFFDQLQASTHTGQPELAGAGENGNGFGDYGFAARFWPAYPRKVAKPTARKAFLRLKPSAGLLDLMLEALERHKESEQWLRGVIPNPGKWLAEKRWQDEGNDQSGTPPPAGWTAADWLRAKRSLLTGSKHNPYD